MLLPSLTITVIPYFVLRKLASSERVIFAVIETFLSGSSLYGESKSRVRHLAKILKKSYPQVIHKVIGHALSTVANGCGRQPKPPPASATLVSVLPVGHGRHVAVPTGTAVAALVALRRSGADARTTGHGSIAGSVGRHNLTRHGKVGRSRSIDHRCRHANREIRRKRTVLRKVLADDAVLSRRQPVRHGRRESRNHDDIPQVRHALDVARIMPSEERDTLRLAENDERHRSDPTRIGECHVPTLHRVLR